MRLFFFAVVSVLLSGCAGKVDYIRPSSEGRKLDNSFVINKPRDDAWDAIVPKLGKSFYVINNMDKSSGFINISYSGDPEKYIDCGMIDSYVKNARGERRYLFPAASAQKSYEIMNPNVGLFFVDRRMSLDGRVNLVLEATNQSETRVTANTRYAVQRQMTVRSVQGGIPQSMSDSITFNSGGGGSFPSGGNSSGLECVSTGVLEREILDAIQ